MFFWIENLAAALGVLSVWLMARQKPIAWPIGFFMVVLYAIVFFEAKLYSETLLQIIYAGLQAYGWWCWLRVQKPRHCPSPFWPCPVCCVIWPSGSDNAGLGQFHALAHRCANAMAGCRTHRLELGGPVLDGP